MKLDLRSKKALELHMISASFISALSDEGILTNRSVLAGV